jgi:hypothetical protein
MKVRLDALGIGNGVRREVIDPVARTADVWRRRVPA